MIVVDFQMCSRQEHDSKAQIIEIVSDDEDCFIEEVANDLVEVYDLLDEADKQHQQARARKANKTNITTVPHQSEIPVQHTLQALSKKGAITSAVKSQIAIALIEAGKTALDKQELCERVSTSPIIRSV